MSENDELLKVHGTGNCHICNRPKVGEGSSFCSYPHGMLPTEQVSETMWGWSHPRWRAVNGQSADL